MILPLKILQSNERIAEAQFVCDYCGKLVRTSMISRKEAEAQEAQEICCSQCKQEKELRKKV